MLFYISFYNSYHFLWIFRISFNIYLKKGFHQKFSFFNRFTKTPHPLNAEQSKWAKRDESILLMFFPIEIIQ